MTEILLVGAALFLVFGNGANDNFKGFATVWGSATLTYWQALILATVATVAGSLISLMLAGTLVQAFSGKGLVNSDILLDPNFVMSVAAGAAATVLLATRLGFPISTTHALIGGLVGAGLAHGIDAVHFSKLAQTFVLPLLISPLVAMMLGNMAYRLLAKRPAAEDCVCLIDTATPGSLATDGTAARQALTPGLVVATDRACETMNAPVRLSLSRLSDRLHILSAAAICFARGVNDTPKLVALLIAGQVFAVQNATLLVAVVMALGGLMFSSRVAHTMGRRLTSLDHTQGLAANLITAGLVLVASRFGMPVSTTHVSVGSIVGVGSGAGSLHRDVVRNILLSWLVTLPMAAGMAYLVMRLV